MHDCRVFRADRAGQAAALLLGGVLMACSGVLIACGGTDEALGQWVHVHESAPQAESPPTQAPVISRGSVDDDAPALARAAPPTCDFRDAALQRAVLQQLGSEQQAVLVEEGQRLTRLDANQSGVMFLPGIECLSELEVLDVSHNAITDTTPLVRLPRLKELVANDNTITDLSVISTLSGLTRLSLRSNGIRDPRALTRLQQIVALDIGHNPLHPQGVPMSDDALDFALQLPRLINLGVRHMDMPQPDRLPEVMTRFENLRALDLSQNRIVDYSPLAELRNLVVLDLSQNHIASLDALESFWPPPGERLRVDMRRNWFDCTEQHHDQLQQLARRGIDVITSCN